MISVIVIVVGIVSGWRALARLVVLRYKPNYLAGALAIALGSIALSVLVLGVEAEPSAKIIVGIIGPLGIAAGVWVFVYGSRLASVLRRLSESARLEGDELVFPRPLRLKPGYLTWERTSSDSRMFPIIFDEAGEGEITKDSLKLEDFRGEAGVVAGLSWSVGPHTMVSAAFEGGGQGPRSCSACSGVGCDPSL